MSLVIFINPDTSSDIYTLFDAAQNTTVKTITTDGSDPTIEQLEEKLEDDPIKGVYLVYVIDTDFVTSLTTTDLLHLKIYLDRLFVSTDDDVDLFYLSNYMDNCINRVELNTQPIVADDGTTEERIKNFSMTTSTAPNGMAGLVTTKSKWLEILELAKLQKENNLSAKLSALVMNEKINAATSQPLFMFPDLMKQTDALDVLKTQYCRIEKNFGRTVPNTENLSLFWFITGASIVVFCAWVLSYYTPKKKILMVKKY